jgi:hypothetical protein
VSALEALFVIVLRPDGETIMVESKRPYRELIQLVQQVEGSEGGVATAERVPMKTRAQRLRGPTWGEWKIEAYAVTETDMLGALHEMLAAAE